MSDITDTYQLDLS